MTLLLGDTLWSEDPVEQEYRSQYFIAGIEAIIRVWVTRGFQESVEDVVEIVKRAHQQQVPLEKKGPRLVRGNHASNLGLCFGYRPYYFPASG